MLQPTSSADEMAAHSDRVPPFAIVVSQDLLSLGQEALRRSSTSSELPLYSFSESNAAAAEPDQDLAKIPTLDSLIAASKDLPPLQKTPLSPNEASQRVAYYCTTSGTGGLQVTSPNLPRTIRPYAH